MALVVAACSSGTSDDAAFEASLGCTELADRWVVIQQGFLDDLGGLPVTALDPATPQVSRAFQQVGAAMTEQSRDVGLAGCGAELAMGGPVLCARVKQLEPAGDAGAEITRLLGATCPNGD